MSSANKKMKIASPSAEPEPRPHVSTSKASKAAPKRTACAACRKRKIRCTHGEASVELPKPDTISKPNARTRPASTACAVCRKRKIRCTHREAFVDPPNPDTISKPNARTLPASTKKNQPPSSSSKKRKSPSPEPEDSPEATSVPESTASKKHKCFSLVLEDTVNTLPVAKDVSAAVECIEKDLEAPTEASTAAKAPKANGTQANTSKQSPKADLYTRSEIADKNVWQGWCEIESEPANFNLMLKEYGVKGVRVLDIYTLDGLEDLPQPVYGAVLLFRYRDVGVEDETEPCPDSLWFANQTAENACATTALLNLMLNAPDVDLGENLTQFKAFTKDFTPFLRGQEIANFEFVKRIHNSFAKKIDILNVDLCMKNEYDARNKPVKKRKATKVKEEDDDEDVPYHFIAFVPVDGSVWRLDGLDREPSRIGAVPETGWLSLAGSRIGAIMAAELDGVADIGYTLLAVVRDPLEDLRQALAANVASLQELAGEDDAAGSRKAALEAEGLRLRGVIAAEEWERAEEEGRVKERRHDYVPLVGAWLRMLAEKGELKGLLEEEKEEEEE